MSIVAGIDSSTQSCTVVLCDAGTHEVLSTAYAPHPHVTPPSSEQDPEAWWDALAAAVSAACADARHGPEEISAVSVAGQHHGLVALDARGAIIRPVKLWNDTTSAPQAARLVERTGPEMWVRRTGSVPTAAFTITKLLWLAENEPENFARLRFAMLPHDWLTLQLCGQAVSDRGDSSGTGYFDPRANSWCEDLLALVDSDRPWTDQLPRVLGPAEVAGYADTARARSLGLRPGTVVGPGTGDQTAAVLGLGMTEGDIMVAFGTSGVVTGISEVPITDPLGAINGTASATGAFQPIVVTLNCARVTDIFTQWLGVDHAELTRLALAADRGRVDRPTLVPFFDGERTPDRPFARGLLANLSTTTTRDEIALSAYEGVVHGLLGGREKLVAAGLDVRGRVLVSGGASRSEAYRRVLASLSGLTIWAPRLDAGVASARGAAIQAAAVLTGSSVVETTAAWDPGADVVASPQPGDGEYAEASRARYLQAVAVEQLDSVPAVKGK
jgi:xylulokinase